MTTSPVPAPAPSLPGWRHTYSGKVRDLYVPDPSVAGTSVAGTSEAGTSVAGTGEAGSDVVLVVASDRISAYDHVLSTPVPDKGRILTALTAWWFERLADVVPNHLVSLDVPQAVAGRAMICRRLEMFPVECVARGYLTGSGLAEYRAGQPGGRQVCGVRLPEGLDDGSALPEPIFTPATKAALGDHDENVTFDQVAATVGASTAARLRDLTLAVYGRAHAIARERGIVLADTKFEFGVAPGQDEIILGDEVLTPDSSRFWPLDQWQPGRVQPSFDKQYVRDWLTSPASGWDRSTTASDTPPPPLPDDVVQRTRHRYVEAYERLTGRPWT